jgi:hypothetical protein
MIGFLAEHAGLPTALGTVALLAVLAAVLVLGLDGDRIRRPALPRNGEGWVLPVTAGLRPVAIRMRPVAVRVRGGAGSYLRDLQQLSVA